MPEARVARFGDGRVAAVGATSSARASGRPLAAALASGLLLLGGCALVPPEPVVVGPVTAVPEPRMPPRAVPNGSIYQPTAYGSYPLFEDQRPRNVGDIVTIVLEERINAAKNVSTTTQRTGGFGMEFATVPNFASGALDGQSLEFEGNNASTGRGSTNANNVFTGSITTTVIGVLPNGNLQVAGEKQIAINRGSEYVKFSGTVDPRSIQGTNTVSSTRVADARIEYRSKGVLDEAQTMGWLQRFFLVASPF